MTHAKHSLTREDAIALGRMERSRAFHDALKSLRTLASRGKLQVHAIAPARPA
ncbi:hypothetical protein [Oceanibium sediminis]|uniref:hypothetical protein n=1 Tax=Oceanibium sediminis TaxID=2026339 RepID=UPI001300265F|nr:hypothetical protein [Oceanibium sediminis]